MPPNMAAAADGGDEQPEPPDEDPDVAEVDPTGQYLRYNEVLGSGALKTVYKAFDTAEGIEVAWAKVEINDRIMGSSKELQRLSTEINLLKSLQHKHILKLYASWVDKKKRTVNIVTELFTSGNLREYRTKHKKVDMKAMRRWARQILRALEYLHSQKPPIIHRDLKCDNIFINGNRGKVKIGDFGLAMVMQQRKAQSIQGTVEFMAPELFTESYNELVDIYSFGMCMLEMVTCECPYRECHGFVQIYHKISQGTKPVALSKIKDVDLRNFIESCLASAEDRLPASELLKSPFLREDDCATDKTISNLEQEHVPVPKISGLNLEQPEPILAGAADGIGEEEPDVLVLRRSGYILKGSRSITNPMLLSIKVPAQNGKFKHVEFLFDMEKDTSLSVATEMVEQLELPCWKNPAMAELIDAFFLYTVPTWKPSVRVGTIVDRLEA